MTVLTLGWPDGHEWHAQWIAQFFFSFREEEYAYLNGPPVPHERLAQRSRHCPVKAGRIFTFSAVFVVVMFSRSPFRTSFVAEYFLTPLSFLFRQNVSYLLELEHSGLNGRPK